MKLCGLTLCNSVVKKVYEFMVYRVGKHAARQNFKNQKSFVLVLEIQILQRFRIGDAQFKGGQRFERFLQYLLMAPTLVEKKGA